MCKSTLEQLLKPAFIERSGSPPNNGAISRLLHRVLHAALRVQLRNALTNAGYAVDKPDNDRDACLLGDTGALTPWCSTWACRCWYQPRATTEARR